jgi:predicted dehydrogenase/threonine dehydrogenase-like Zn-dependent dehydrogenase
VTMVNPPTDLRSDGPSMRQVAQNYKSGELVVLESPEPTCRPGGVLVQTLYSLISTGTELMKVHEAGLSLVGKARARPDQVRKLVDSVAAQGPVATYHKAMDRLDSYTPLGYSTCGVVLEVGQGVDDVDVGDIVACAGNEFALHADVNWVPKNLCVPVPAGVSPEHAAFATVGAIAMQGLRRAEAQIGETACVIGLGLIGQLLVRLLAANGVRVVGLDPIASRRELARQAGAVACADPNGESLSAFELEVAALTAGIGVDHVFLVAGGGSNGPVEIAVRIARDRGRVIDIGKTRLDLPWNSYYEKELDVRFSRSYGPGRYDEVYELDGVDYPPGYVRWTERRNLGCFLDLLASERLDLAPLTSGTFPIDEAADVYHRLENGSLDGIGYLFSYDGYVRMAQPERPASDEPRGERRNGHRTATAAPVRSRPVRLGLIGAGNYATSMLLPPLAKDEHVRLARASTARSLSAVNVQRKFDVDRVSTNSQDVLEDESLDAVLVLTRHHSHAHFVCEALRTGKAVYVEKPLALTDEQIDQILSTIDETGNDRLMVGFNRRFAPLFLAVRDGAGATTQPGVARYLVNAGQLAADSWYSDRSREGSRFVGEGGHFIDTLSALFDDEPAKVFATTSPSGEDIDVHLTFRRGSIGSITYVTNGNARFPKETLDVSAGGRSARLDNFQRAAVWKGRTRDTKRSLAGQDKGQPSMLSAFIESLRSGGPMPIPLEALVSTTRATLAAENSASIGTPELL